MLLETKLLFIACSPEIQSIFLQHSNFLPFKCLENTGSVLKLREKRMHSILCYAQNGEGAIGADVIWD